MTTTIVLSRCFSLLALRQSVYTASPKYVNNSRMLLTTEGTRSSFARSFAVTPNDETSPESNPEELIVDQKNASKMRSRIIPVETSMKYLKSKGKYCYIFKFLRHLSLMIYFILLRLLINLWGRSCLGEVSQKFQGSVCTQNKEDLYCKF